MSKIFIIGDKRTKTIYPHNCMLASHFRCVQQQRENRLPTTRKRATSELRIRMTCGERNDGFLAV